MEVDAVEGGWGVGSGLAGLCLRGTLTGESFGISRNGLVLGGVSEAPDVKARTQTCLIKDLVNPGRFAE